MFITPSGSLTQGIIQKVKPANGFELLTILLITTLTFLYPARSFSQQTCTWTGAVSQAFDVAGNWTPAVVPGQQDTIVVNSGTVNVTTGNPVELGGINLSNGTISLSDSISVSGKMSWSGGTLTGTGTLTCAAGAMLNIQGSSNKLLDITRVVNQGTMTWEGTGWVAVNDGGNLENQGLFEIMNSSTIYHSGGAHATYVTNRSGGIIRKISGGKTIFGQSLNLVNEGLFEVLDGSLEVRSNGTISGTLEIKNASPLILGPGQVTWTSSSLLKTNGEVILSGTYDFWGTFDVLKKTSVTLNRSRFTGTVKSLGDTLDISGCYIDFLSGDVTVPVIRMTSGYLGGTAGVTASSVFEWSGGTIQDAGSITIPVNGKMNITGAESKVLINHTVNNLGTVTWEGTGFVVVNDGTVFNNSGLFEILNSSKFYMGGGANASFFNNLGTGIIRKTSGGTTTFSQQGLKLVNQGTIDLQAGTMSLWTTGTFTGNIHSEPSTLLSIELGTQTFNPGVNLDLEGSLLFKGGVTLFNTDYTFPPGTVMTGGDLGGLATLTVSDTLVWSGGTLNDTGTVKVDAGGVLLISGPADKLVFKRKILNLGQIHVSDGYLIVTPYSVFLNHGEFVFEGPMNAGVCCGGGPDAEFRNMEDGRLVIDAAGGEVQVAGWYMFNDGYVEINRGTFSFLQSMVAGIYTQTGGTTRLIYGDFRTSREVLIKGGLVCGTGRIRADLFNAGTIDPGLNDTVPGSITITGQYRQDTTGTVKIDIGGRSPISGYDQLTTGTAALSGDLHLNYIRNFQPFPDDRFRVVRWTNQVLQGTFDTITNLQYAQGKSLDINYTNNCLLLGGERARKDLWLQVIGPTVSRPASSSSVKILYGNESPDTIVFPLLIRFENIDDFSLLFEYVHYPDWIPWEDPDAARAAYDNEVRDIFLEGDAGSIPLMITIPGREPDESMPGFHQLDANLIPNCEHDAKLRVASGDPLTPELEECLIHVATELIGFLPGGACVEAGLKMALSGMTTHQGILFNEPRSLANWITDNGWGIAKCAASLVPGLSLVSKVVKVLDETVTGVATLETFAGCANALLPQEGGEESSISIKCVASKDPNMKVGPEGTMNMNYIKGNNPLAYAVFFENVDTATAPAQRVWITDTLEQGKWDLETFSFVSISLADTTVYPPSYEHAFSMEVDLRPDMDLIVGITGSMEDATGILRWEFISLDPVTHNPTTNPLSGFLPPNVTSPEGEGSVVYIVQPNLDLPSGTGLGKPANIIFDNNEAMATNDWMNHLDRTPPVSSMESMDEIQISTDFELRWIGSDTHSGIRRYFLYASENGGPFVKSLVTDQTSCTFRGDTCNVYSFFVLAQDSAGNMEPEKEPELQVTVNPFLQPELEAVGNASICEGDSVLLRAGFGGTGEGDDLLYEWYRNNVLLPGIQGSEYYALRDGDYSVNVGLSESCSGTSDPVSVTVRLTPEAAISANGNLLETASGQASYQWYLNESPVAGATSNSYDATISGDYRVGVTGLNGCSGISEVYHHIAIAVEEDAFAQLIVFPNPAGDQFAVRCFLPESSDITVEILTADGKVLSKQYFPGMNPGSYELEMPTAGMVSEGLLLVRVTTDSYSKMFLLQVSH